MAALNSASGGANATAGERAYEWTREAILSGRFPEGSFLEEKIVCEEAGVSRTPVREAFRRLAAERFVDLLPRRGAQVRPVTALELVETYEMRSLLELHGFEILCSKRIPVPPSLENHLDLMEDPERVEAIKRGDRDAINEHAKMDYFFHSSLIRAAGNSVHAELFETLRPRQQRIAVTAVSLRPHRLSVIAPQHRAIYEALVRFDFDTAAQTLRQHLSPDEAVIAHMR
ncbi:GntR family transcriptional regulator [Micromonospora sp. B11E3]|uniref:GntR family transcriptional regulator n=1 Tax=Micromonospora sp. B11E3 TaxID=3153562 RepID=UPI00325EC3FF